MEEARIRAAFDAGQVDGTAAGEVLQSRVGRSAGTLLVDGEGNRRSSAIYLVLAAPEQGITSPRVTTRPLLYRQWVARQGEVPAATGKIRHADSAIGRSFASGAELDAFLAGAGLAARPAQH